MAVIDVRHFAKSFSGRAVHKDVTFTVEKGECVGLVGGSGTSDTLTDLLGGLLGGLGL